MLCYAMLMYANYFGRHCIRIAQARFRVLRNLGNLGNLGMSFFVLWDAWELHPGIVMGFFSSAGNSAFYFVTGRGAGRGKSGKSQ